MRDILSCKNFSPLPIRLCGRIQIFLFTSKIFCPRCASETWKKVSVGGNAWAVRPLYECSRARGDLTLLISSSSGIELMTQWRPPQRPIERQKMRLHTRNRPISKKELKDVELKIKIAKPYLHELRKVLDEESALLWAKSIPVGIERELLLLIALNSLESDS